MITINKEGIATIIGAAAIALVLLWLGIQFHHIWLLGFGVVFFLFSGFSIYFFRDPERTPPAESNILVSPCDGKVIEIENVEETEFVQGKTIKISIFMSVFNVHVNYIPITGKVDFMRFHRGKYFRADDPKASFHNVNILTGLITDYGNIAFKQATGMVARRLVNHLHIGDNVKTGQKFGIIKFGSRMEIFLPLNADVAVKLGDKVCAGESIIASFR